MVSKSYNEDLPANVFSAGWSEPEHVTEAEVSGQGDGLQWTQVTLSVLWSKHKDRNVGFNCREEHGVLV